MVNLPQEDHHFQFLEDVYLHRLTSRLNQSSVKLVDLERFGTWAAKFMLPTSRANHEKYRQTAINRMRQSINMEFKLCCHICHTPP